MGLDVSPDNRNYFLYTVNYFGMLATFLRASPDPGLAAT